MATHHDNIPQCDSSIVNKPVRRTRSLSSSSDAFPRHATRSSTPYIPRSCTPPLSPRYIPSHNKSWTGEEKENEYPDNNDRHISASQSSSNSRNGEPIHRWDEDKIVRGFPVLEFIDKVWKSKPKDIPKPVDNDSAVGGYTLDSALCKAYLSSYYSFEEHQEWEDVDEDQARLLVSKSNPDPYEAFSQIADDIFLQLGFKTQFDVDSFAYFFRIVKPTESSDSNVLTTKNPRIDLQLLSHNTERPVLAQYPSYYGNIPGSKRKRAPFNTSDSDEPSPKRARVRRNSDSTVLRKVEPAEVEDSDVLSTIREYFSTSTRSFVTGVLVNDTQLFLWYADRMGIIRTKPFDFIEQPHILVLVLTALSYATSRSLGLCPYVQFPWRLYYNFSFNDLEDGERVTLTLPDALDVDNHRTGRLDFEVDVQPSKRMFHSYEITGRGTTVLPIIPKDRTRWLLAVSANKPGENLVAKVVWASAHRRGEEELVRVIRRGLSSSFEGREYLRNVTDLRCSFTHENTHDRDMDLPSVFMKGLNAFDDARTFKVFILKAYLPLKEVNSPDEFKTIYIQAVKAHHWVVQTSGILHCDISDGNVMFYREGHHTVVGVLSDWDLAQDIRKPTSHRRPLSRTGTRTFMSTDFQREIDPPYQRLYRHDLEAFFFLLVWFCASFIPDQHEYNGRLQNWSQANIVAIGRLKIAFVQEHWHSVEDTFADVHENYRPLIAGGGAEARGWVRKLRRLFRNVTYRGDHEVLRRKQLSPEEDRSRDWTRYDSGKATYESFMRCLGEEV